MMFDLDESDEDTSALSAPAWAVFGDLMTGLLGAFVLILMGVVVVQMDLVATLKTETEKRRVEEQRRIALEKALAVPLATGRVTITAEPAQQVLVDGEPFGTTPVAIETRPRALRVIAPAAPEAEGQPVEASLIGLPDLEIEPAR